MMTNVRIRKTNHSKIKAYVDLILGDCFVLKGFKVVETPRGLEVSMPSLKTGNTYQSLLIPLTVEKEIELQEIILKAYESNF